MNATNRKIAQYRILGLAIIIFSIFCMAMGLLLIQERQQLAIRAQMLQNR